MWHTSQLLQKMETVIPDNLFESINIEDIISEAKDYALCNGKINAVKQDLKVIE